MSGDVPPKVQDTPPKADDAKPANDPLQAARLDAGTTQALNDGTKAAPHLPNISIDQPYNPYGIAGKYDPNDIKAAKGMGLNADEVHLLEEGGGDRFHQTMAYIAANPARLQGVKAFADTGAYLQNNPDATFNPANVAGTYRPDALDFGKSQGFNSDQMHVLEQWGPQNFNGIMDYLKQNPNQVDNFKQLANTVGYWETHGDLPTDPKATYNQPTNEALQVAQQAGFTKQQAAVLGQFGADNFNNTMAYIKQHPESAANFKNLAMAVGTWESQVVPGQQPTQTAPKR